VTFGKVIARNGSQTLWILAADQLPKINITSPLNLKRIEPKQLDEDIDVINKILSSAT
jgi:hypothetical protein